MANGGQLFESVRSRKCRWWNLVSEGAEDRVTAALSPCEGRLAEGVETSGEQEDEGLGPDGIEAALARAEHRHALELCAQRFGASLGRLCLAMLGSQSEAEEIAQETLLDAYRGFDGYAGRGSVRAWLFGIARKKCLKQLSVRSTHQRRLSLIEGGQSESEDEDSLSRREEARQARLALDQLPHRDREVLVLRYVSELSYAEVAEALELDEATARKRASRALGRLRAVLRPDPSTTEEA